MAESTEEDIKKFLKESVKKSGFSLENDVTKILKKNYKVRREIPFYDKDQEVGRAFDVEASKFFPDESHFKKDELHSIAQYKLLIECKNIPGNIWVFSSDEPPGISLPEHSSINQGKKPDPVFNVTPYSEIPGIPYASGYDEYVFDKKKSNKQPKNLFSAIMTVTKAIHHEKTMLATTFENMKHITLKKQKYILHIVFLQSVIVFTGKIYLTKYHSKDEPQFFPQKFVQIRREYESKDYHEIMGEIHIVSFEHFEEYLEMVDKYYLQNEHIMIKNKEIFLKCARSVYPNLPFSKKS